MPEMDGRVFAEMPGEKMEDDEVVELPSPMSAKGRREWRSGIK